LPAFAYLRSGRSGIQRPKRDFVGHHEPRCWKPAPWSARRLRLERGRRCGPARVARWRQDPRGVACTPWRHSGNLPRKNTAPLARTSR